jgi:hypothetical protein
VQEAFNIVAQQAAQLFRPAAPDPDDETPDLKMALQTLIPISPKKAFFTVIADGLKYPVSYAFVAMAIGDQRFHIVPASQDYDMPHMEEPQSAHGYCLDDLTSGDPDTFVREIAGNYVGDQDKLSYEPPVQRIVDARRGGLLPN